MRYQELFEAKIIAYHGTGQRIEKFYQPTMAGHFFTKNKEYAKGYTGKTRNTLIDKPTKARNYLLTVELDINHIFDTATDPQAVAFYNEKFRQRMNLINTKYHRPLIAEITLGEKVSFINADDLYRYFMSFGSDSYDGLLVDEGGFGDAYVPLNASQIKILKREIVKFS